MEPCFNQLQYDFVAGSLKSPESEKKDCEWVLESYVQLNEIDSQ